MDDSVCVCVCACACACACVHTVPTERPMNRRIGWALILLVSTCATAPSPACAADPIRVLIVDGRNNHDWRRTTESLAATLKATGRFAVDVSTVPAPYP